ncbi:zinc finger AN1 domain-containing stress-associated protein 15-like [Lolium perenne]|uniref:zinc finger AN1 domain-containing stress-associated protein 15-like n=1 Tax=Lolium perenne TaxID=4522 RepID=UPI0021F51413|nr:zinc finger AN1 domain-containing stress-associated protein 15-like [Lolium perenne]
MAQESCDLNKDEAEILKPSSSTAPSPPSPTTTSPPPPPAATQTPEPQPPQSPPQPPPAQFSSRPCEVLLVDPSKKRKRADADADAVAGAEAVVAMSMAAEPLSPVLFVNRCNVCRKRVGLTGFRCRCEKLFCPRHRHSETHNCSFDYKTAGREEIARANPLIRAAKVIKI